MDILDFRAVKGKTEDCWLFIAREELFYYFIDRFTGKSSLILNIGCGLTNKIEEARRHKNILNMDINRRLVPFLDPEVKKRFLLMDACKLGFKRESFHMIIMSDVLEHIEDDEKLLEEAWRVLKKGGHLVITVPAFPFLFGPMDIYMSHFRRYTKNSLIKILKYNFQIVKMSYWIFFIFVPAFLTKLFKKVMFRNPKSDFFPLPRWLNKLLLFIVRLDNYFIRKINLPIGMTIFLIAQKI